MKKVDIRRKFLKERQDIGPNVVKEKSDLVHDLLIKYISNINQMKPSVEKINKFFLYSPIQNELDVLTGFRHNFKHLEGMLIGLPRCGLNNSMDFRKIAYEDELEKDNYGILTPKRECEVLSPDQKTLIVVPCVSISKEGYRIGYGAGYYDKFLLKHDENLKESQIVALCYSAFVTDNSYNDSWDKKINVIITEEDILDT